MFSNELSYSDIFSLFDKVIIDNIIIMTAITGSIVIIEIFPIKISKQLKII